MGGGGDGNWAVLPSPPLAHATLTLVGKIGTGKSATANCILWTDALSSKMSYISVTKTCKMSSATFQGSCGATHTVNVVDTPGLFDMEISIEAARSEIVKCIEMTKDGIHAMLIVFSAASRFPREEHSAVESINLFFGDKILDHIILVFTHGDEVEDEIAWKKMLTVESPVYRILFDCISRMVLVFCLYPSLAYSLYFHPHFSQDMLKLCQNRVVLFDNKNNDIKHREMQRRKLLDAVDFVISSNRGNAFSYQMLPHIQEAIDGQTENSVDGYIAEKISEQISEHLKQITKTVDEKLNNREGEIRRLSESLEKSQREHDNVKQEMKNAENLRKLDEEKRNAHEEEIKNLREEFEKARRVEMLRMKKEIKSLTKSLKLAKDEEECYKCMGEKNECFIL